MDGPVRLGAEPRCPTQDRRSPRRPSHPRTAFHRHRQRWKLLGPAGWLCRFETAHQHTTADRVGVQRFIGQLPEAVLRPSVSAAPCGEHAARPLLQPEEVLNTVVWLMSDQARWITGVALPVDAGRDEQALSAAYPALWGGLPVDGAWGRQLDARPWPRSSPAERVCPPGGRGAGASQARSWTVRRALYQVSPAGAPSRFQLHEIVGVTRT